jgi:thioredoxin-like negative regulator of GroEL
MVVLFHLVNWDVYSLEIIPLKVKDYSKLADEKDYLRIAQLCEARKKPSCQESALVSAAFFKPKDADLLMRIAKLQLARRAYTNALQLFGTILRIDPKYDKARLELAKLLIASNNKKEAKKHLNYLVFSNNSLETNITAAREFVKLLMDEKDYVTAKNVIEHTRSKGEITALFLEKEYLQITQSQ